MLTLDDIIKTFTADHSKGVVGKLAVQLRAQEFDVRQLIDLTFHPHQQTGFRAAWVLDTVINLDPAYYAEAIPYLAARMPAVTHQSCKRHYARIMMHLTSLKAPAAVRNELAQTDLEPVAETCFDWMIDPNTRVAVQVFAADTLFNLIPRYDWIRDELANQVQFMMRTGTAAMQSRGKKLLAQLARLK